MSHHGAGKSVEATRGAVELRVYEKRALRHAIAGHCSEWQRHAGKSCRQRANFRPTGTTARPDTASMLRRPTSRPISA